VPASLRRDSGLTSRRSCGLAQVQDEPALALPPPGAVQAASSPARRPFRVSESLLGKVAAWHQALCPGRLGSLRVKERDWLWLLGVRHCVDPANTTTSMRKKAGFLGRPCPLVQVACTGGAHPAAASEGGPACLHEGLQLSGMCGPYASLGICLRRRLPGTLHSASTRLCWMLPWILLPTSLPCPSLPPPKAAAALAHPQIPCQQLKKRLARRTAGAQLVCNFP